MAPDTPPPTTHVVEWKDEHGNSYIWPHSMSESSMRRDRVLARMARFGMDVDESTLRIWKVVSHD